MRGRSSMHKNRARTGRGLERGLEVYIANIGGDNDGWVWVCSQ